MEILEVLEMRPRYHLCTNAPLLRVSSARPLEVYSQATNLERRANRLSFEQVRVIRPESPPTRREPRPADVFAVVDSAVATSA